MVLNESQKILIKISDKITKKSDQRDIYILTVTKTATGWVYSISSKTTSQSIMLEVIPETNSYKIDDIFNLNLHEFKYNIETKDMRTSTSIFRVHNGWIYFNFNSTSYNPKSIYYVPQFLSLDSTGSTSISANNGLTIENNNIELGGIIEKETIISSIAYDFKIVNLQSEIIVSDDSINILNNSGMIKNEIKIENEIIKISNLETDFNRTAYVNFDNTEGLLLGSVTDTNYSETKMKLTSDKIEIITNNNNFKGIEYFGVDLNKLNDNSLITKKFYNDENLWTSGSTNNSIKSKTDGILYIQTLNLKNLTSEPSNPEEGSIYYNKTDKNFYGYDGTNWNKLN